MQIIYEAFLDAAARVPDNGFVCIPPRPGRDYDPDGIEYTYAQVRAQVQQHQEAYRRAGYGLGNRVALLLENRPQVYFHWLALNALGASIVPINPDYKAAEVAYLLTNSEADLVVALSHRIQGLQQIIAEHMPHRVAVVPEGPPETLPPPRRPPQAGRPERSTEVALQYTSGTTGNPKGCMLSNAYFFYAGERYINAGGVMAMAYGQERMYNPLPLFYANTLAISNPAMILKGGTLIIPDRFHPSTFWQDIATTGATLFHYLGIVPPVLLKQAPVPDERQHRLKFGYGAGINPVDHRAFEQRFNVPLCEGWGMVEMAICAVDNYEPRKLDTRSFGQPLTGVEFRIVDGNDQEVSVGTEGELTVRRAGTDSRLGFFSGYFNNAEATAEAWRGGWFHTGDMVRRDESGTYYFVDRIKNIIRRSAQNIAAVEIEAMLQAHEAIAEVAVIAAPDEIREEEVFACIVLNPDYKPVRETAEAIIAWSQTQMSYFKVPGWLLFMERLPLTSTQKMQKARIFSPGEDPRQAPGAMDFRDRKQRR